MSEQPENQRDSTAPYDPDQDPDAQAESLNPRSGEQASEAGETPDEEYEDTDADPANLNPRSTQDDEA
jgi:hypothetical protein